MPVLRRQVKYIKLSLTRMKQVTPSTSKINWSPQVHLSITQQQAYLGTLCRGQKAPDWKYISTEMNSVFPQKSRSSKQCRERFHNYVRYCEGTGKNGDWTPQEDQGLFRAYIEVGSKWAEMTRRIGGRSENNIKNRFYGRLRKFIRIINEVLRKSTLKNKKPIKQQTLTKILSRNQLPLPEPQPQTATARPQNFSPQEKVQRGDKFLDQLKYDILRNVMRGHEEVVEDQIAGILGRIHQFNLLAKAENIRENRKGKSCKRKTLPPLRKELGLNQGEENNNFPSKLNHNEPSHEPSPSASVQPQAPESEAQAEDGSSPILKESYLNQPEFEQYFKTRVPNFTVLEDEISFLFEANKININRYDSFEFQ